MDKAVHDFVALAAKLTAHVPGYSPDDRSRILELFDVEAKQILSQNAAAFISSKNEALYSLVLCLAELGPDLPSRRKRLIAHLRKTYPRIVRSGAHPENKTLARMIEQPDDFTTYELYEASLLLHSADIWMSDRVTKDLNDLADRLNVWAAGDEEVARIMAEFETSRTLSTMTTPTHLMILLLRASLKVLNS